MTAANGILPGEVTPAVHQPEVGGRKPKPPPRGANDPVAAEAFKAKNHTNKRPDFKADDSQTQASKYRLIWDALIQPAPLKLVLLAMAHFSNDDGSSIRPAIATVGRMCSLSPKQARRHVQALVEMGVLTLELERKSKGGTPTRYALNLEVLASLNPPTDGSDDKKGQPSHAGTSTLPPVTLNPPADGSQPTRPTLPSNVGEGGVVPTAPPSAGLGHSSEIPAVLRHELFEALVANGPGTPTRISALIEKANELVQGGHDINAMAQQALEAGWKRWPLTPRPSRPTAVKKRTTGRARALVIDRIRDTRAPGRNYKQPGVEP